jgi:hypothetical protein
MRGPIRSSTPPASARAGTSSSAGTGARRSGRHEVHPESKLSSDECAAARFVRDATNIADTFLLEFGDARSASIRTAARRHERRQRLGEHDGVRGRRSRHARAASPTTASARTPRRRPPIAPGTGSAWQTRWYAQTGTIYEIPTPYAVADLPDLQLQQKGDVITITHPSYPTRELQRTRDAVDPDAQVTFGPSIAAPIERVGDRGGAGAIRYWAVTAIKEITLEESLADSIRRRTRCPSAGRPTRSWIQVAGAISYNVYRSTDGVTYGLINSAGGLPTRRATTAGPTPPKRRTLGSASNLDRGGGPAPERLLAAITDKAYDGNYTSAFAWTLRHQRRRLRG